jgi:hypothetical protein
MANLSSKVLRIDRDSNTLVADPEISADLPSALVDTWREQLLKYSSYWQWMDGEVWETVDKHAVGQKGRQLPLLFPVQLNPLYTAAQIHRNTLFGEVPDTAITQFKPRAIPKSFGAYRSAENGSDKGAKVDAQFVTDVIEAVMYQSSLRGEFQDAGFVSQALGGCVWQVCYEPDNPSLMKGLPVAIRQIEPEFFLPIWSVRDRWHLLEARIGRMIDRYEAKELYGVETDADRVLYLEAWKRNSVAVTVDGKPASIMKYVNGDKVAIPLSRPHRWGFVPLVYTPHETVGQFYGVPIVHELANLLKEYNGRVADVGDAVRNSIERLIVLTNADAGDIKITNLDSGIKVISTGREMSGTQGKKVDLVGSIDLPQGTGDYIDFLKKEVWHGMFTPAVAYGEDEGSQRSALTLAFRMWPLTSHIRAERSLWSDAWRIIAEYTLRILRDRQSGDFGDLAKGTPWRVEDKHLDHMYTMDWAPMIPRDRESEINQLILRHQDGQLSTEGAMERAGDIQDIAEELERVQNETEDRLKQESKYAIQVAKAGAANRAAGGGASGSKSKGAKTDTQQPVAKAETD